MAIGVVYGDIGTSSLYTLRSVCPPVCLALKRCRFIIADLLRIFVVSIEISHFVMRVITPEGDSDVDVALPGVIRRRETTSMLVIAGLIGGSFFLW